VYPEAQWVRLALQAELDTAGLKYRVEIGDGLSWYGTACFHALP
jgi:hypothetical protein